MCLLHLNTTHLAQIIVLFGLRGSVSEITAHFLFGNKLGDKHKIWPDLSLLHMNSTHWAQIIVLLDLRGSISEIKAHFLFGTNSTINVTFGQIGVITSEYYLLGPNYRPFRPMVPDFRNIHIYRFFQFPINQLISDH